MDAVRAFVTAAEEGQFQQAAARSRYQPAGSLETHRRAGEVTWRSGCSPARRAEPSSRSTARRSCLTPVKLLRVEQRADALRAARPAGAARRCRSTTGRRRRGASPGLPPDPSRRRARSRDPLDADAEAAIAAVEAGTIDASFHAVVPPHRCCPRGSRQRRHDRRGAPTTRRAPPPAGLRPLGHARAISPDTGSGCPACSREANGTSTTTNSPTAFGLTIERVGPVFGSEHLLRRARRLLDPREPGRRTLADPVARHYDLRRIPIRHPTPVYPLSLIWHQDNPHPALGPLLEYLASTQAKCCNTEVWAPSWAQPPKPG